MRKIKLFSFTREVLKNMTSPPVTVNYPEEPAIYPQRMRIYPAQIVQQQRLLADAAADGYLFHIQQYGQVGHLVHRPL